MWHKTCKRNSPNLQKDWKKLWNEKVAAFFHSIQRYT
ncbi:hypothetical protein WH47_07559 [Habropoda laboriosa]|uniref:Uncharacterized protein n=1 Tax=Habropoda laboriosa TaxID=597456 RepID=A0A0L7RE33_9HYME|nr:hypothetical protein WH47_07559 [Habropoda laboriosa]